MKIAIKCAAAFVLAASFFAACKSPVSSSGSSGKSISASWGSSSSSSRTIVPASYPTPASYDVILTSGATTVATQTGLSSSTASYTFSGLRDAASYTVTVNGKDARGVILVTGSATADLTSENSAAPAIVLSYITTTAAATGTGTIQLTFDASAGGTVTSTAATLVDPHGTVTTPTLGGASPSYTLTVSSATVGAYRLYAEFRTTSAIARVNETIIVAQGVTTAATVTLAAGDFTTSYQAVTSLSLPSTSTAPLGGAAQLTPAFNGGSSTPSNQMLVWSTDNSSCATVGQDGTVTGVSIGTANITVASVENLAVTATCAVTVSYAVLFNANGGGGTMAPQFFTSGQTITLNANTFSPPGGYQFAGWTTALSGAGGTSYADAGSLTTGAASIALYAVWLPTGINFSSSGNSITITGATASPPTGTFSIPAGVTAIGTNAFNNVSGPSVVNIPGSVTSIGYHAFLLSYNLASISVDASNTAYSSGSGILFDRAKTTLIQCPYNFSGAYTVPATVTSIGDNAFTNCSQFTGVTLPSGLLSIGYGTFAICAGLTTVTIPSTVTSIGSYAFNYCQGLTSVVLSSSLASIGMCSFQDCSALTTVTIPASVTSIGLYAFNRCSLLTSAYVQATTPPSLAAPSCAFDSEAGTFKIYVPSAKVTAYQAATGWSYYSSAINGY